MDDSFKRSLLAQGLSAVTVQVLEEEDILTERIFYSLRAQHIDELEKKVKVGQHATLYCLWEEKKGYHNRLKKSSSSVVDLTSVDHVHVRQPSVRLDSSASGYSSGSQRASSSSPGILSPTGFRERSPVNAGAPNNLQQLAEYYKNRAKQKVGVSSSKQPKLDDYTMIITLGGMVYDSFIGKGVRRKCLPEPNPRKVEVKKSCTLSELFMKAKETYFHEVDVVDYQLAEASGMPITLMDESGWTLGSYYKKNCLQPSRHKIYVIAHLEPHSETEEQDSSGPKDETTKHTEPVVETCISCSRPFRTYVPMSHCHLPNGGIVCYKDPQTECPLCDERSYGDFMNMDLFPELEPQVEND